MPSFHYKAYAADDPRRQVAEEIEADNMQEAAKILRNNGYVPIEIEEINEGGLSQLNEITIGSGVKQREKANFTRQIATMIRAGMSPLQALEVCQRATSNKILKKTLGEVRDDINAGETISQAMAKHEKIFDRLYVSLVRAGEIGGVMPEALDRLADQMEKDAQIRGEIRSAMVYPLVVLIFAFVILTAMVLFVVPSFQQIFESGGGELPKLTAILVAISDAVRDKPYLIVLVPGAIIFGIRAILKSEDGRRNWDKFKLKAPMKIGPLIQKIVTARFARTLSTLQEAGIPILEALDIAAPTASNVIVEEGMKDVSAHVQSGMSVSRSIRQINLLPEMAVSMLEAGEQSGEVNVMLAKVADTYEQEVTLSIKNLKSIMEPIMMILIGGVIGVTVVALYLPIFKVYDQIK